MSPRCCVTIGLDVLHSSSDSTVIGSRMSWMDLLVELVSKFDDCGLGSVSRLVRFKGGRKVHGSVAHGHAALALMSSLSHFSSGTALCTMCYYTIYGKQTPMYALICLVLLPSSSKNLGGRSAH